MVVRISTTPTPCRCDVYDFPHRTGGGACRMKEPLVPSQDDDCEPLTHYRHEQVAGLCWKDMGMGAGQ